MNNIHVAWTSRNKMSTTRNLYCCLVPQREALRTYCSAFPITTKWCFDQDVKVLPGTEFQWCTGSGFWSPVRADIWIFWIWIGLDILFLSTGFGSGLSKWKKSGRAKILCGLIVVWGKITIFRNHVHIVILCFERRFSKQNSVIRLKSNILAPQNFWAGYATAAWQ